MSIETAVVSRLRGVSAFAILIGGSGTSARLYPQSIPKTPTFPLMTYLDTSEEHGRTLEGAAGIANSRFEFTAYGLNYSNLKDIHEALRNALLDDSWWRTTVEGHWIYGCDCEDGNDLRRVPTSGEDFDLNAYARDFTIWYDLSVP